MRTRKPWNRQLRILDRLKRKGERLVGLSPFRDEKSPSFSVDTRKNIWNDFGGKRKIAAECIHDGFVRYAYWSRAPDGKTEPEHFCREELIFGGWLKHRLMLNSNP